MSWRISQQYGFGAASVELAAEPHFVAHRSLALWGAMRDAGRDFYLTSVPPLVLAVFMIVALFVTVSRDRGYTDLEVVMISSEPLELAEETAEPVVEPEPVLPEPEPPEPVERLVERKPAEKRPEPPPPPPRQLARQAPRPPPPAPKPKPRPAPVAKPVVKPRIDALALQPPPRPAPPPPARRGNRVRELATRQPDLKPALAPLATPEPAPADANRTRRFEAVRASVPAARPKADLGPPIAARSLDAPAPAPSPARTRRAVPPDAAERRVAKVSFAAAPAAPLPSGSSRRAPPARGRAIPTPVRDRRAPPPPLALAAAAPAAPRSDLPSGAGRRMARAHAEPNAPSRADHTGSTDLAAVPLASLKACVSEREEEALKRRLVAAVTTQRECVSRAGTYRFVETKNLNAFLMTIERAADRSAADRCVELRHALACVSR